MSAMLNGIFNGGGGLQKPRAQVSGRSEERPLPTPTFNSRDDILALRRQVADLTARLVVLEQLHAPRATSLPPRDVMGRLPEFQAAQVMAFLVDDADHAFDVPAAQILSDSRLPAHVEARDWAAYQGFLRGLSTPQIGRGLNRDHTSVMAGINREAARRAAAMAKAGAA